MNPDLLEDREKATDFLETIHTCAEDAANMIGRLREAYRLREDQDVFYPVDVKLLVKDVIDITQPKWKDEAHASGRHYRFSTEFQRTAAVPGIMSELREAIMNLVLNALDAMPAGGTLSFRTRQKGNQVTLEICDTGIGMSGELIKRCMDPFFTTKGQDGTGLGLSMVHGIVERHGGSLSIKSQLGQGSTFKIVLPIWNRSVN